MAQEFYAIDLPGKILYPKQFNCSIRKITPLEQKYILSLSQKEQRTNDDYIAFLKKLVQFDNPEMTFEELYQFDVQYILYRIRFTTYPNYPVKIMFYCNGYDEKEKKICNQKIEKELKAEDLLIVTPDDLPNQTNEIELENLGKVSIRNKVINDDKVIENFAKIKKIDITDSQMKLLLLDLCFISGNSSLEELYNLAEDGTITAQDIVNIEHWFENNIWGVKEELKIKCPVCGKESSRAYILAPEDFFSIA